VYLPQRDTPEPSGPGRTRTIFDTNLRALQEADVVVAVCDGAAVDDGTAWEVGYAVGRDIPVVGLRTDSRITQPDERINLMILEGLAQLTPSIETVVETLRAWEGRDAGAAP
jgi:nucleoside 2-deoxyribosyltransferase